MHSILVEADRSRLEGSCEMTPSSAGIRVGPGCVGIERLEARFLGRAFEPHRHDTYAIGVTLAGVQTFRYRGTLRRCLPGQCHVLHPDELHDGAAGSDAGFAYRIAYVDPALIQQAIGGAPLPFVGAPLPFVADPVIPLTACRAGPAITRLELGKPAGFGKPAG